MPKSTQVIQEADPNPTPLNEDPEDTDEQSVDESSKEESKEETKEESSNDSQKEETHEDDADDFKSWAKENDLPDDYDSPDKVAQAVKNHLELARELKRLQTEVDRYRTATPAEKQPERKSIFNETPVAAMVDKWVKDGMIPEEHVAQYRGLARLFDSAVGQELQRAEHTMAAMYQDLVNMQKAMGRMEWQSLPTHIKSKLKREDVERVAKEHNLDLEAAARFYAFTERQDLIPLFFQNKEKQDPNKQNKRVRWGARGGGSDKTYESREYEKYILPNGEVDAKAINSLPRKKGDQILDDIIRAQSRRK